MGTSENRDCQWVSRSVLNDFTADALTISAGPSYNGRSDGLLCKPPHFHRFNSATAVKFRRPGVISPGNFI